MEWYSVLEVKAVVNNFDIKKKKTFVSVVNILNK